MTHITDAFWNFEYFRWKKNFTNRIHMEESDESKKLPITEYQEHSKGINDTNDVEEQEKIKFPKPPSNVISCCLYYLACFDCFLLHVSCCLFHFNRILSFCICIYLCIKWYEYGYIFCPGKRKPQSFMCEECGKIFNRADLLRNHKRVHSGDKPFTCEVCGDKFRELGHLRRHMTRHTG